MAFAWSSYGRRLTEPRRNVTTCSSPDIDTYKKGPEGDLYANFPVNYLKIDKTPGPNEDYGPILKALRDGNFFVTTGEILIRNYAVAGTGNQRTTR